MPIITGAFAVQTIVAYAAGKGLDHILRTASPSYQNKLERVIDKTIEEFGKDHSMEDIHGKFHFYKSQTIIDELLKYRFFKDNYYVLNHNRITLELKQNQNILLPNKEELNDFLLLFETFIKEDEDLIQLAIEDGYKAEIFNISMSFNFLFDSIKRIEENTEYIKRILDEKVIPTLRDSSIQSPDENSRFLYGFRYLLNEESDFLSYLIKKVSGLLEEGVPKAMKSMDIEAYLMHEDYDVVVDDNEAKFRFKEIENPGFDWDSQGLCSISRREMPYAKVRREKINKMPFSDIVPINEEEPLALLIIEPKKIIVNRNAEQYLNAILDRLKSKAA